jgi:crotonobetainyl-CoA:carnitine CoA-transferase CaiB-like acyl-CoA transferase
MDRLGVGYDVLNERRPSLVYAALTGFGLRGPLANRAGHDLNFIAFAGLLDQLGAAGSAPVLPPVAVSDLIGGGLNTSIAVLAMLSQSRTTGVGGRVDTSLAEGAALLPSNLVADVLAGGPLPAPGTAEYAGGSGAYNVYALADGYVSVGAVEPQFWRRVSELLEEPELITRVSDDAFVRETLTRRFAEMTKAEAQKLFDDNTCVEVVYTYQEAFSSPHAEEMDYLRKVPGLDMPVLAPPYLIDGARPEETVVAPRQGEHTTEIMTELGFDAAQLEDLQQRAILAPRARRRH